MLIGHLEANQLLGFHFEFVLTGSRLFRMICGVDQITAQYD